MYLLLLWQLNEMTNSPLKSGGLILFLVLHSFQFFWSLLILMKWFFSYYEINPKDITLYSGILFQKKKYYSLERAESISLNKSVWGRLFNFGTLSIDLYMANSRYEVLLKCVPNPEKYVHVIEKTLSEFGARDISSDN